MQSRAVTFVIFDGFDVLDVAGPFEVFGEAGYELTVVAPKAGPVRSDTGLTIHAQSSVASLDPSRPGTLLVVGGEGVDAARSDRSLVDWVAAAATKTDRVASVCLGAFILAEAGLLDGRRVTTHWREADRLAREYPAVIVDSDPIFIQDGPIWTSAGVAAGMDLALALVEADLGPQSCPRRRPGAGAVPAPTGEPIAVQRPTVVRTARKRCDARGRRSHPPRSRCATRDRRLGVARRAEPTTSTAAIHPGDRSATNRVRRTGPRRGGATGPRRTRRPTGNHRATLRLRHRRDTAQDIPPTRRNRTLRVSRPISHGARHRGLARSLRSVTTGAASMGCSSRRR